MQRSRHSTASHACSKVVEYIGVAQLLGRPPKGAVQPGAGLFPARSIQTVSSGCRGQNMPWMQDLSYWRPFPGTPVPVVLGAWLDSNSQELEQMSPWLFHAKDRQFSSSRQAPAH